MLQETEITLGPTESSVCGPFSSAAVNSSAAPVALRLHDQARVLMEETHFVGCVVQKSEGAVAYLVHRASSFVPEIPKLPTSERLVWSFAEVYAPFVLTFSPSVFTQCSGASQTRGARTIMEQN